MSTVRSYRTNPGSVVLWTVVHAAAWSFLAVALSLVEFVDVWQAALFGAALGFVQGTLQWLTTSVSVDGATITIRRLGWTQRIKVTDIEVIQRARHRRWSGVIVRLRDGQEVVLSAPTSSVYSPNPNFDEEVHRLCANIALGDPDGVGDEFDRDDDGPDEFGNW